MGYATYLPPIPCSYFKRVCMAVLDRIFGLKQVILIWAII